MNTASAADLTENGYSEGWGGAYVGLHAGYAHVNFENGWCANTDSYEDINNICIKPMDDLGGAGAIAGLHAGYNHQMGGTVLGIEADVSQIYATSRVAYEDEVGGTQLDLDDARAGLDFNAMVSVRARLGIVRDDFLLFATGGMAYIDAEYGANTNESSPLQQVSVNAWTPVAGAGIEWKAMQDVSLKLEGLHYFGKDSVNVRGLGNGDDGVTAGDLSDEVGFNSITTIRAGIGYHF